MITEEQIRHADFWDEVICLSCGLTQASDSIEADEPVMRELCPGCARPSVWSPSLALEILGHIESGDDE